jgi:protein TonB
MKAINNVLEFENLVFEGRNKEYGAYVLRRLYNKYVSISTAGAIFLFVLIVSYPLITASFFAEEEIVKPNNDGKVINFKDLTTPPIDKPDIDISVTTMPKTSTIKYLAPVVMIDELVTDEYIPTVEDLVSKNPGAETVEGNPNGTDIIDDVIPIEIPDVEPVKEQIYTWLEEMPSFIGGDRELINFLVNNLSYPEIAKRAGVEGKVILSFIVDKSGKIKDVEVLKGIGAGCDEEAMRVINSMPNWNPGKQNGKPVITKLNIPVVFKLN